MHADLHQVLAERQAAAQQSAREIANLHQQVSHELLRQHDCVVNRFGIWRAPLTRDKATVTQRTILASLSSCDLETLVHKHCC